MSRSALWRQEAGVEDRERRNREIFETALLEGKNRPSKGVIPMVMKEEDTFNLHPTLLRSLCTSQYFLKLCQTIHDWNALVDAIYYDVSHVEPFMIQGSGTGAVKVPSQAFCLLLRLFTLRCSEKQMHLMLTHADSPYIRCIGFLFLRYVADPNTLLSWYKPYLFDEESVQVVCSSHAKSSKVASTIGSFVRSLLQNMDYYGTLLPRLPISVEKNIKDHLAVADGIERRALQHLGNPQVMRYFQTVGNRVQALYQDDENPIAWYDAVIDRIILEKITDISSPPSRPTFVVTFSGYGNTETISLGEMDLPLDSPLAVANYQRTEERFGGERQTIRKDDFHHGGYRQESYHTVDKGHKPYASRPMSVNGSLTSGGKSYNMQHAYRRDTSHEEKKRARGESPSATPTASNNDSNSSVPMQRSAQDIAVIEEKKRKLLARYG